ncbi:MAG: RND family transporter [Thermodesulfobacteriota bacterium]
MILHRITEKSLNHPWAVVLFYALVTVVFIFQFPKIKVDTDPENMLTPEEPARVTHRELKREFALHDSIVVGVVDDSSPEGVFVPETLARIAAVTEEIAGIDGVISYDLVSLTTTDDIRGAGGVLTIEPLMKNGVTDPAGARAVRDAALENPILRDMLVSGDGRAVAIAVPIREKDQSWRISKEIEKIIERHPGTEVYHITGLPVAEDTFGVEMFRQMAVSAPLAGLIIFLLMLLFFRRVSLVISPMIVAMVSIVWTMGLLIGSGYTVHIMSSMIPIFLMPIAVVDSVHVLSEFFDEYRGGAGKKETFARVFDRLMTPMLYTSVTSSVGFASLALTPIPPVRVFGLFVAFGIMSAWLLTITLVPAFTMLMPERFLTGLASGRRGPDRLAGVQRALGRLSTGQRSARWVLVVTLLMVAASAYGVSLIVVNDNPVHWFTKGHRIRVADRVLNEHFGGTYMAYLVLEGDEPGLVKSPETMGYIERLQGHLTSLDVVGKTTSIADVVKKIGYELADREAGAAAIPDSSGAIAQYLFLYEMSGDPEDLYHLVDPDYTKAAIWLQLKRGDNVDMKRVTDSVEGFLAENPPPGDMKAEWAGLTYINVVWQDKMVAGMLRALLGSFVMVLIIMVILFRSIFWGLVSMVPLTVTIALIYGLVGATGKNYDMPIAVLSALTLGLSVDFAIHLVQRTRQIYAEKKDWAMAIEALFEEPVRAIIRNAVVIALGFTPLLLAPLMPYKTVGFFMAAIMAVSCAVTLVVLPSIMTVFKVRQKR